ncbi:zinc metalloprotease [Brevibacillus dissolubilis]|uniref:zinc metalloprotease n=1 Tax=Brevibacillus dissolubilis TaxID=1844116 RepID=UPI001116DDF3|nr:zinc metalloprotease [Brevibacillus dissolubilis]
MVRQPREEQEPSQFDICGTMQQHWRFVRTDPEYRWRARQLESEIQDWMNRYESDGLRTGIIRIPVVVHVIYNNDAQNISDEQIRSQIPVINQDFRRMNADAASTPARFAGVAADARIEFALAVRDPDCNPTTGITRTRTDVESWPGNSNGMKDADTGGHDPWDVTKYLNIWVVNFADDVIGSGTYPSFPANIQGVVIHYRAFGTIGDLDLRYNRGRSLTHEIGHYLDLLHIWGDDGGACTGSDNVEDTPNQANRNIDCPQFPIISCSNEPNGDMFMNYMDYTWDTCKNLFTAGQVARMTAALHVARATLLGSDGLVPVSEGLQPDLWMKDAVDDTGEEPDPSALPMYISDDIWVRRTQDGLMNQDHENPVFRPSGSPNYVYVRVRNRGCSGSRTESGTLRLYWAKASTGLSWPAPWDGSVTTPALMGGLIGSQSVSVAGGEDEIYFFPWSPPNPADYASLGAEEAHFCLLARIETTSTPPFGMTFPETSNLYANVQNNNNIVWKNISIVEDVPGSGRQGVFIMANYTNEPRLYSLMFRTPKDGELPIFDWGKVFVTLPPELVEKWKDDGDFCMGVRQVDCNTFQILKSGAGFGKFRLEPNELHTIKVQFVPAQKYILSARVFALDAVQRGRSSEVIGGVRFLIKNPPDTRFIVKDTATHCFDGVSWVPCKHHRKDHGCSSCCHDD